jgi:hypothetical protein
MGVGLFWANVDQISTAVGDPSIANWVHSMVDGHPIVSKYTFAGFSVVVVMARLRTLIKWRS